MIYRFGAFELDIAKAELRAGGELRPLEPQVYALLALLVENRERLLSRDEIIEKVWDGRVVSDAAVASRIKSARQALGDDGQAQRFIRTVQRKGFRFVAAVSVSRSAAPAPVAGTRLAVAASLVDTRDDGVVWAERLSRKIADVPQLLADIGAQILASLEVQIPLHEAALARSAPIDNLDAWSAYHLGLQHMYRFNREDNAAATALFRQAVTLDPFVNFTMGRSFWLDGDLASAFAGRACADLDDRCRGTQPRRRRRPRRCLGRQCA